MQIVTTLDKQNWHNAKPWLERLIDKTDTAQIIVYNQMDGHTPIQHPRLGFWDMREHVVGYDGLVQEVNSRLERAMSEGARSRIWSVWHSQVRDIAIADFMLRSPYEFFWLQPTAWPEYSMSGAYIEHSLHTDDCVLWNHLGHQRTDCMMLGGSHALRGLTGKRIMQHYATGIQWVNQNPNRGWQYWLQDWQRRVIEGDDAWQFY